MKPLDSSLIPAFPTDFDRDAFGNWLSGFSDGEATFNLYAVTDASDGRRESLRAAYRISLRADDADIIHLIQSFFGCGTVIYFKNSRCKTPNAKPVYTLNVSRIADLINVVIPHFRRFPLRSKKGRDFEVFAQGAEMIWTVAQRPHPCRGTAWRAQKGISKWIDDEREQFKVLVGQLKSGRRFDAPAIKLAKPEIVLPQERTLFD